MNGRVTAGLLACVWMCAATHTRVQAQAPNVRFVVVGGPDPAKADEKRECGLHAAWGGKAATTAAKQ